MALAELSIQFKQHSWDFFIKVLFFDVVSGDEATCFPILVADVKLALVIGGIAHDICHFEKLSGLIVELSLFCFGFFSELIHSDYNFLSGLRL